MQTRRVNHARINHRPLPRPSSSRNEGRIRSTKFLLNAMRLCLLINNTRALPLPEARKLISRLENGICGLGVGCPDVMVGPRVLFLSPRLEYRSVDRAHTHTHTLTRTRCTVYSAIRVCARHIHTQPAELKGSYLRSGACREHLV